MDVMAYLLSFSDTVSAQGVRRCGRGTRGRPGELVAVRQHGVQRLGPRNQLLEAAMADAKAVQQWISARLLLEAKMKELHHDILCHNLLYLIIKQ